MEITFNKNKQTEEKKTNKIWDKIKSYFKDFDNNFYFYLMLCGMGLIFFFDSIFTNQFTTLFGGDYMSQQLSFYTNGYDDWWTFIRTGKFVFFDTNTFLGVSNVGSNSFYYLFDPFFLPILICPREFIAQGMVFLTIFKIATAGIIFMHYMKYMGASKSASRISALAYAFSGWVAWFLWFNHMTEIAICFPIMLLGVEKILKEKKPWILIVGTFLMGITNYFFLFGMTLAAFFYAMFRFFQRIKENKAVENWKILGVGFIGFFVGLLLTGFAVLPSLIASLEAPRAANSEYLNLLIEALKGKNFAQFFSYLFEWKNFYFGSDKSWFRHFYPIINFFFPCASCRGTPLTQYGNEWYDNVATNIYCYVPLLLFFVPAFVRSMKQKKWSVLVAVVLFVVALETPFFYYMFFGFTAPYGRWELFFVAAFIAYTGLHIDHAKEDSRQLKIISYIVVVAFIIFAGFSAQLIVDKVPEFTPRNGDITIAGATLLMCLYTTIVFVSNLVIKKEENRNSWNMTFVALEVALMGFLTIEGHWCGSFLEANNGLEYNNDLYQLNQRIQKDDKSFYRAWSYLQNEEARNDGMRNNYNGLGCFHSLYNFQINNFVNWTQIQDNDPFYGGGSWAASYVWKNSDIDKFLGVKYYYVQNNSPQWGWMGENGSEYQYNVPLDFVRAEDKYQGKLFETFVDTKPINFAIPFDSYCSYKLEENSDVQSTYDEFFTYGPVSVLRNDERILESAMLNEKQAGEFLEKYPGIARKSLSDQSKMAKNYIPVIERKIYDLHDSTNGLKYSVNTFFEDYAQAWLNGAHALTSKMLINVDDGTFARVDQVDDNNKEYGRYVTVLKDNNTNFEGIYDEKGYVIYVPYRYSEDYAADIYLISDNNKIITWDRHQDDKYAIGGVKYRGFYVHGELDSNGNVKKAAPKLSKIVVAHRNRKVDNSYYLGRLYYEKYSQQQVRYETLYKNAIYDLRVKVDTFRFKTNHEEQKVVVTQLPFEKGWSIKAKLANGKKKNVEVFSAQGGFASFVSEIGETEYYMSFYPDYMKEGTLISLAGVVLLGTCIGANIYVSHNKKKKEKLASK